MEWKRVEDGLPDISKKSSDSEDVLVLDLDGKMYVGYLSYYPSHEWKKWDTYTWSSRSTGFDCCSGELKPTHWMPLPEKP